MFARDLRLQRSSFFLFGSRGTGKSTWLKQTLPEAFVITCWPLRSPWNTSAASLRWRPWLNSA